MVYHEIRKIKGSKGKKKIQNYLVYGRRDSRDHIIKESKFLGYGEISKKEIEEKKEDFNKEITLRLTTNNLSKDQIIEVEELKRIYREKISSLSKEEFEKFENTFFTELTYNSNAIEGSSLSLSDTNLIVNEGIVPEGKTLREINEANNHIKAINYVNNYKGNITEKFILGIHERILKNISQNFAGRYRETSVRIFGSEVHFPPYHLVPQLVKNLVYWYNDNKTKLHPLELAVVFSMKFVSIHPFIDGNGRTSRLLMNYILKKNDYPWINIYMKQRAQYLKSVRLANDEDYKEIIAFCITTLKENLKSFNIV